MLHDLGAALAAADNDDASAFETLQPVSSFAGMEAGLAMGHLPPGWDVRFQADTERQVAGHACVVIKADVEQPVLETNLAHRAAEAQIVEVTGDPSQIARKLAPRDRIEIGVEEFIETLLRDQVAGEGPGAGRQCRRHQILHEGGLQFDALQHHARMPVEGRLVVEEMRLRGRDGVEMRGEA